MSVKEEYDAFMAELRNETGIEAFTADESGLVSVRVDDAYNVNLQFVEATGKILCFVEVAELPKDAPKDVYRDLLVGGLFGKDTAGGFFAVEPESEAVVYNYFFDLETAAKDVEGFISTIEKILQLCDIWAERIRRVLAGEPEGADGRATAEISIHDMIRA
ncbi:MAG: type III secretion system chaperone [Kiritimatiellae bacterium]|nr:type III secretion system chaperone [Kiritimatiellia bacterium]